MTQKLFIGKLETLNQMKANYKFNTVFYLQNCGNYLCAFYNIHKNVVMKGNNGD